MRRVPLVAARRAGSGPRARHGPSFASILIWRWRRGVRRFGPARAFSNAGLEPQPQAVQAYAQSACADAQLDGQRPSVLDLRRALAAVVAEDQVAGLGRQLGQAPVQALEPRLLVLPGGLAGFSQLIGQRRGV